MAPVRGFWTTQAVAVGIPDPTVYLALQLSSGAPATGLTHATSGLTVYTFRTDLGVQAVTLVSQTPTGAWTSGGFCEVNATTAPGLYRLDLPATRVVAGSAEHLAIAVKGTGLKEATRVWWLDTDSRAFFTVGASPTRYTLRLSGGTVGAGQYLRRQLQVLTGAAAHERVTIIECDADGDVVLSPPLVTAPAPGDRVVVL